MPYSSADPNAFLAIGMQSALGTPQVTAAKLRFAKYLSGNNVEPQLDIVNLREGGDGLDWGYTYKRRQMVQGQLVMNARPEIMGQFLQLIPGGATWDGASGPPVHTFHTGHASHPWATILAQHPGSTIPHRLSDVRFTGFTLEMSTGEPWKVTAPFQAINHQASFTALVPTYFLEDPILFQHSPAYLIDGATDTTISGVKITVALGIEDLQAQSVQLDEMVVQNRDISVEITRRYENSTLWKKVYMGGGLVPTTSVATGSLSLLAQYGAAAALRSLQFDTNLLTYSGDALTELDPDGKTIMETISAKALKGATHALIAIGKNSHASAYAP